MTTKVSRCLILPNRLMVNMDLNNAHILIYSDGEVHRCTLAELYALIKAELKEEITLPIFGNDK